MLFFNFHIIQILKIERVLEQSCFTWLVYLLTVCPYHFNQAVKSTSHHLEGRLSTWSSLERYPLSNVVSVISLVCFPFRRPSVVMNVMMWKDSTLTKLYYFNPISVRPNCLMKPVVPSSWSNLH
jgi:hypothetical protein